MPKNYSFDQGCLDLAKKFLDDEFRTNERLNERDREYHENELAQELQRVIEDYINFDLEKVEL